MTDMTDMIEDDPFMEEDTAAPVSGEAENQEGAAEAAPVPEPKDEQVQGAAPGAEETQIDQVIDKLDKTDAAFLLKLLGRFGIDQNDPLITGIHILLDTKTERAAAVEAATAAANAAGRIEEVAQGVGDDIYKQTLAAGKDLQSVVTTALHDEVVRTGKSLLEAINRSTVLGAQKIEKAALGLDEIAKRQQAANVRQWRDDFAAAARLEMKSRYMRSWSAIAATLLVTLALGAALMFGGLNLSGKIFPWGWRKNGTCGESVVIFQPPGQAAQRASLLSCGATQD